VKTKQKKSFDTKEWKRERENEREKDRERERGEYVNDLNGDLFSVSILTHKKEVFFLCNNVNIATSF
jgi:hypothetical protein